MNTQAHNSIIGALSKVRSVIVGQEHMIGLAFMALLIREHLALIGPAGEGKTYLASAMAQVSGGKSFYRLLTRYTTPDEILGHYSLAALKKDRYERVFKDMAPDAEVVVLDEVFKANSPTLNGLLGMLNEREVDGVPCKLVSLIGCSNEFPAGIDRGLQRINGEESLLPLWDRFLFRHEITRLEDDNLMASVMTGGNPGIDSLSVVDLSVWEAARKDVAAIANTSKGVVDSLIDLRGVLAASGVSISTRRWAKCRHVMAAHAYLSGRDVLSIADLPSLQDCLWTTPDQRSAITQAINQIEPLSISLPRETLVRLSCDTATAEPSFSGATDNVKRCQIALAELARARSSFNDTSHVDAATKEIQKLWEDWNTAAAKF